VGSGKRLQCCDHFVAALPLHDGEAWLPGRGWSRQCIGAIETERPPEGGLSGAGSRIRIERVSRQHAFICRSLPSDLDHGRQLPFLGLGWHIGAAAVLATPWPVGAFVKEMRAFFAIARLRIPGYFDWFLVNP
jgi:hypothetical protein